jgi:hypothetical protein
MTDPITEKYAKEGKRDAPATWAALECIAMLRIVLGQHREAMELLVEKDKQMDNIGGLLHPSLYRDMISSPNYKANIRLVKATLKYLDEIDEVTEVLRRGSEQQAQGQ